jgi:hypothetical protein
MAIKYYQNKNIFDTSIPGAAGTSILIKPNKFVIDKTGEYYSTEGITPVKLKLTEVTVSDVIESEIAYTYDPVVYGRIDNTDDKLVAGIERDAGGASVGGADTQIQFNDGGVFGGSDKAVFNKTTGAFTLTGPLAASNIFEDANSNVAVGSGAMLRTTTGTENIALGEGALESLDDGSYNIVIGSVAGKLLTSGEDNVIIGRNAGENLTGSSKNIAIGKNALQGAAGGQSNDNNIAIGTEALVGASGSTTNIAIGEYALYATTSGDANIAIGPSALSYVTTGYSNVGIGDSAGNRTSTGSYNTFLGNQSAITFGENFSNVTVLGAKAVGSASNQVVLGDDAVTQVLAGTNTQATMNAGKFKLSALNTAPASATAAGVLGEIRVAADAIYVCTAPNTWVKAALATW